LPLHPVQWQWAADAPDPAAGPGRWVHTLGKPQQHPAHQPIALPAPVRVWLLENLPPEPSA